MVQRLAYVGLGVADEAAWVRFATDVPGLMLDRRDNLCRLRLDERAWRIAVHPSPTDDILYAGFEVDDDEALSRLRRKLAEAEVECVDLTSAELDVRQVAAGFSLYDPDGLRLEVVSKVADADLPFRPEFVHSFQTGDDGLGHIVIAVSDLDRAVEFYQVLGLALSDFINAPMGPEAKLRIAFMHCNGRHHSLAMAQLPGGKRLNHLMIEMTDVDDVIRSHRRSVKHGYPTGGLGRHPNDRMLSFYVTTPGGFDIECGWGGCRIDVDGEWKVREYDMISLWGHERPA